MIPDKYKWLLDEGGPRMLVEGLKTFGTLETPGVANNPTIMSWARELGLQAQYTGDSIPWCGLWMALIAKRSAKRVVAAPLWALHWAQFDNKVDVPMLGDVLVFKRNGGGHVGLYIGEDSTAYHVLGGNQSDSVCITRIAKSRLYAARRPKYNIQPANVRRILLSSTGKLSENES